MPTQDTSEVKEKILSYIREKGPLLPVQIAREIGISSLFISAYLSELISAKKLEVSKMKVGNSPLYYIPGQENSLENFSTHLKPQEKEAIEQLKEKQVLKDSDLEPATRVALQSVQDFAIPFEHSGEKYWRYMTISEEDALQKIPEGPREETVQEKTNTESDTETEGPGETPQEDPKEENSLSEDDSREAEKAEGTQSSEQGTETSQGFEEPKFESPLKTDNGEDREPGEKDSVSEKRTQEEKAIREKKARKKTTKKSASKKSSSDKTNKFFNKVKEHLSQQGIEINDIVGIGKDELILKISEDGGEKLLVAFNKNKLNEEDLVKAYKKAADFDMKYTVLSKNGALKKVENLLEAIGKMDSVKSMK
ncbi:MAG: hypothetical protein ABEI74_03615 [Candidatus Pacearchaeota archaeon]